MKKPHLHADGIAVCRRYELAAMVLRRWRRRRVRMWHWVSQRPAAHIFRPSLPKVRLTKELSGSLG